MGWDAEYRGGALLAEDQHGEFGPGRIRSVPHIAEGEALLDGMAIATGGDHADAAAVMQDRLAAYRVGIRGIGRQVDDPPAGLALALQGRRAAEERAVLRFEEPLHPASPMPTSGVISWVPL